MKPAALLVSILAASAALSAQEPFTPARLRAGGVPALSPLALGGGEVLVEVVVNAGGRVEAVTPLRSTPPFTQAVVNAVRDWAFAPAEELVPVDPDRPDGPRKRVAVASRVLVAAVFRQPTIVGPTLGEPVKDTATPSDETPSATVGVMPTYPVTARDPGVVVVEARIDRAGALVGAAVVRSAPPFDEIARAAVEKWSFRAGKRRGQPVPAYVYAVLGFPVPVGAR